MERTSELILLIKPPFPTLTIRIDLLGISTNVETMKPVQVNYKINPLIIKVKPITGQIIPTLCRVILIKYIFEIIAIVTILMFRFIQTISDS
jgi:hypothetical protein